MRRYFIFLLLAVSFLAISCGKTPSGGDIVGKWTCPTLGNRTMEFRQDGSLTIENPSGTDVMVEEGTYQLDGKKLTVTIKSMKRLLNQLDPDGKPVKNPTGQRAGSQQEEPPGPPFSWRVSISSDKLAVRMGEGFGQTETFTFQKVQ